MATLASDSFDRANAANLGANWIINTGDFAIVSNQARATVDDSLSSYDGGISWPNDQWSQATLNTNVGNAANNGTGTTVRGSASAGTDSAYEVYCSSGGTNLYKSVAGAFTQLGSTGATTWAAGNVCYLEIQGTALVCKKGGSAGTSAASASGDTTFLSGKPGIQYGHGGTTCDINDWSGGDFSGGGVSASLTGQAVSSAAGTLTPATSKALSGSALANAQGTLAPSTAKALAGQALASAQTAPTPNLSIALTGQALSFGQGTLTATQGDVSVALTGQALTAAAGTLAPSSQVVLSGSALTGAQGTVTPISGVTVALTGQAMSMSQGSLASDISALLAGQSISIAQGRVSPPSQAEEITGGGYFLTAYDRELIRRMREKKRREELEEESQALPDQVERDIALLLRQQEEEDARQAELQRLRSLVRKYSAQKLDTELSERALVAYTRALAQENYSALEALERELSRQIEEEDHAILMLLLS